MYGKSKVMTSMPRAAMPSANAIMNALRWPAPAPCARMSDAVALAVRPVDERRRGARPERNLKLT